MENQQKTVLITGATSGIGYELAKLFAQDKYNLVITGRHEADLYAKADEFGAHGVQVTPIVADLVKKDEVLNLCQEIESRGLQIDILVNDAGQGQYGLFVDNDLESELDIIHLNICSVVILTKHFLKKMVQRNEGKILNLASIASKVPGPWQAVYHGTKAFVLSFSEGIRSELKDTNITVTALLPGATDTDFFNKAGMQDAKIVQDKDSLSDAPTVAKDGYDALMAGDDKVISGFKNKAMIAMANFTPDSIVAEMMKKQQEPAH